MILNAGQSMTDGGKSRIIVGTRLDDDGNLIIEVADTGKGMNEQTMKQIFDPFFTTKRSEGGTGLGLVIAYRIVEEHGGRIAMNSKPGEVTTFSIRIPANAKRKDT